MSAIRETFFWSGLAGIASAIVLGLVLHAWDVGEARQRYCSACARQHGQMAVLSGTTIRVCIAGGRLVAVDAGAEP